ncbi:MAG: PHP domain-containing protein [Chloroflexi bacterium]|nr:PHP domain-containing protein [Chloroflexota bacterium]
MIIDLHTHTFPLSEDSNLKPLELIQAAKQSGLDGICVTEHDWFWDKDALAKLRQENDFLILPGVEINTMEGHILVFGVEKYIFGMNHVEELRRVVDEAGGAMILAHPSRGRFYSNGDDNDDEFQEMVEDYCQKPWLRSIDIIETSNGRATRRQNRFAQELSLRLHLKGVGSSDAHSPADIPTGATLFERKIHNLGELITELRAGRFQAVDLRHNS